MLITDTDLTEDEEESRLHQSMEETVEDVLNQCQSFLQLEKEILRRKTTQESVYEIVKDKNGKKNRLFKMI